MPPKSPRCAYVERNRRCGRKGTGNPPLCDAHRVIVEAEIVRPQRAGEHLIGLLGRVLRGQKVSDDHLYAGLEDAFDMFQRQPSFGEAAAAARARVDEWQRRQFPGQATNGAPRQRPQPRKPAGPDPRVVLGFAIGQKVTVDEIKKRHRDLARRFHPDRGGDVRKMSAVNHAVDQLLAELS